MLKAAIVNVTGYAGVELARLLLRHPDVKLVQVTGRGTVGQRLDNVFPHLDSDLPIVDDLSESADVIFVALPHKAAAGVIPSFIDAGAKVVDISADFRLKDQSTYERWYGVTHPAPQLLPEAVYGLPELHREEIRAARLVANPGCYPTSAILGLLPALSFITGDIIIDAKSGVSGAGRTLSLTNHYSEANENCQAYALEGHRHLPEIEQELAAARNRLRTTRQEGSEATHDSLRITFLPHLIPMTRGILSTCYSPLARRLSAAKVQQLYKDHYAHEPFVRVTDQPPQTKQTWGSNYCLLHPTVDSRSDRLIVISCLDNLVKGAAGQAVQNMNLMFGLDERTGIGALPIYP